MGFIASLFNGPPKPSAGGLQIDQTLPRIQNNIQSANTQQQNFLNALGQQNGIGNQSNVFNQQQALADTLQAQSQGAGPNPAQAQLAQNTGNNMQNQAALMASQRGIGANPGLLAQQAAQQGAQIQQNSVGQGATLQAQQNLAQEGQLQNQQANLAGLATQQVGQQQQGIGTLGNLNLSNQGQLLNMQQGMNNANMAGYGASIGPVAQGIGGVISGVGTGIGHAIGLSHGGKVPEISHLARHSSGGMMKQGGKVPGKAQVAGDSPKNDKVKALLSPGEVVIPRSKTKDPKKTAEFVNRILGMNLGAKKSNG